MFLIFHVAQFDGPHDEKMPHPIVIVLCAVSPSYILLPRPTFGWLLCPPLQWQASKPKVPSFSLFLFFVAQFNPPNNGITPHPFIIAQRAVSPTSHPLLPPTFGCLMCRPINRQPPKGEALPISLFFDQCHFGAPNKGTSQSECKPGHRAPAVDLWGAAAA